MGGPVTRAGPALATPPQEKAAAPAQFTLSGEATQGGWQKGKAPGRTRELQLDGKPIQIADDGSFFLAFDRDAESTASLVAIMEDGSRMARELTISPRAWKIEHVNIARRRGGPSEAFMRLRRPELEQIGAARAMDTGSQGWRQSFIWPSTGRISGRFGSQRIYRGEAGSYHSGVDVAGGSGAPIVAPADGVVILAADHPFTLEGNLLMLDHGMGLNSAFLHCSQLLVREGQAVRQGQLIARIGMTGRATGPHLHWSMKWNDARIDPLLLAGPMR